MSFNKRCNTFKVAAAPTIEVNFCDLVTEELEFDCLRAYSFRLGNYGPDTTVECIAYNINRFSQESQPINWLTLSIILKVALSDSSTMEDSY